MYMSGSSNKQTLLPMLKMNDTLANGYLQREVVIVRQEMVVIEGSLRRPEVSIY